MIEPMYTGSDNSALVYNIYKDIDNIVLNLQNILFAGKVLDEYDLEYLERAATKFYAYDKFMSMYTKKSYLTPEDMSRVRFSGALASIDKNQITDHLNAYEGYSPASTVYMNFGKYARYVDVGDINYLATTKQHFMYYFLDKTVQRSMRSHIDIVLGRAPRHLSVMETVVAKSDVQENAQCILELESMYTRLYTYVFKNIYYPLKSRIKAFGAGKQSIEQVIRSNFISPEQFLRLMTEKEHIEVRIKVPVAIDLPNDEKFEGGSRTVLRTLDEQIDYMDMFNSISLLEEWWSIVRDFYLDASIMGQEYVDKVLRFCPEARNMTLLQSGITFMTYNYDPKNNKSVGQMLAAQTGAFNICWWLYEWQRQAKDIAQEYDLMFHANKGSNSEQTLSAHMCSQMLDLAKYKVFKNYYAEGDYILTTILPYENILEVDSNRSVGDIYFGSMISQYELFANKLKLAPLRQMLDSRGHFSMVSSRSLVTARILRTYEKQVEASTSSATKYLCDMEINYYSEGKKYESMPLTIDIAKWYSLPFKESEYNQGVDYRVEASITNPSLALRTKVQEYCDANSVPGNELKISPDMSIKNIFLMNLVQNRRVGDGVKTYYSPRVGVTRQEIVDVNGRRMAYMPNNQLYGSFMDMCSYAFKSPFTVHTTSEVHFDKYLSNDSDIINQGLRFRFSVNNLG